MFDINLGQLGKVPASQACSSCVTSGRSQEDGEKTLRDMLDIELSEKLILGLRSDEIVLIVL